jgi:hypothetical protein
VFVNSATKRTAFLAGTNALLTLTTLVLLAACQRADEASVPEIRPVRVTTIESRAASGIVSLTGSVQAQTEINESFRIDGRLVERTVDIGDKVKPGQLIARLDPQNEESGLQSARAQLAAARAQLVEARNNHARMRELVAEDAVSRASFDQAVALLKTAESQVEAVQSQVSLAENRLSYTRLSSNAAGVVTARGPEPGEVVSAGRMIIQVAREGARDAVFDVPGRNQGRRAEGSRDITVALTDDPRVTVCRPGTGSLAARGSGDRHLRRARTPDRPAAGHAPGQHRYGQDATARGACHRGAGLGAGTRRRQDRGMGGRHGFEHRIVAQRPAGRGRRQHRAGCGGPEPGRDRRYRGRAGAASGPEGPLAREEVMIGPNLSEWALAKRSLVVFLMIVAVVAGTFSFMNLGRGEDPAFTFRTMVVAAAWPGATVDETLNQVTERLERTLQETDYLERVRSYTTPARRRSSSI